MNYLFIAKEMAQIIYLLYRFFIELESDFFPKQFWFFDDRTGLTTPLHLSGSRLLITEHLWMLLMCPGRLILCFLLTRKGFESLSSLKELCCWFIQDLCIFINVLFVPAFTCSRNKFVQKSYLNHASSADEYFLQNFICEIHTMSIQQCLTKI